MLHSTDTSPLLEDTQPEKSSLPLLNSTALLFESENILQRIYAVNAFHETTEIVIEGVWSAFLSSLLINGIVNFYLYPDEREGMTLLNVFGLTSLLNLFCIEQVDFSKKYLCYKTGQQYEEILASSLNQFYVWPLLIGVPLFLGVINGLRESLHQAKALDQKKMQDILQDLDNHHPGFARDVLGLCFLTLMPSVFQQIQADR